MTHKKNEETFMAFGFFIIELNKCEVMPQQQLGNIHLLLFLWMEYSILDHLINFPDERKQQQQPKLGFFFECIFLPNILSLKWKIFYIWMLWAWNLVSHILKSTINLTSHQLVFDLLHPNLCINVLCRNKSGAWHQFSPFNWIIADFDLEACWHILHFRSYPFDCTS